VNPPVGSADVVGRSANHDLVDLGIETVERFIAGVLGRAHQTAIALGAPDEARAILDVAQLFADELARAGSGFDRLAFVAAVTEDPS
jgi:hypothetical protein